MTTIRKKLIEVALPLEAINKASAREKSIRHGHPSTLHLWWARRPLAAARAVIFAQMVDDPSSWPDLFPTEKKQEKERQRLFKIIEELVRWENTTNEAVLQAAREEIWASWRRACAENAGHPRARELFDRHKLPAFHDPFAGGGALPLEAQRLGLEAYASDLNPVAVLINKAMIEIPPKFAGRPPVNPASRKEMLFPSPPTLFSSSQQNDSPLPPVPPDAWRSRGYLPHFERAGAVQAVTFRLADSLPQAVLDQWEGELASLAPDRRQSEREKRIAAWIDRGAGECHLKDPRIAEMVEQALLHFDGERYRLIAWCLMPNHVHALIETLPGHPLSEVLHSWKSFTAKQANRLLGRTGPFWQTEYHDRFIRDDAHFANAKRYIEENPLRAGLVAAAGEWRWSSAWEGGEEGKRKAGGTEEKAGGTEEKAGGTEEKAGGTEEKAGGTPALPAFRGAQGLAEDVRYYGKWMRDEAVKRIGRLYPKIEITAAMAQERPDLRKYVGQKLTVIAWLWARTVKSPNPAFADVDVPLASTFMLSTKKGKEAYVEPVIENDTYRFTVKVPAGSAGVPPAVKAGTKLSRGANFECLMSGTPIAGDYIKAEGRAGRMGARLMAIVAEGDRGRVYLAPTPKQEAAAGQAKPEWKPEVAMPDNPRWFSPPLYGLTTYGDLFTPRQLVALTTFSDLVQEARERVKRDALAAGLPDDGKPLADGGTGAAAYAEAVGVYLACGISRSADFWSSLCIWANQPKNELVTHLFGRQAIPMAWDHAEANPFSESGGNFEKNLSFVAKGIDYLVGAGPGYSIQLDAATNSVSMDKLISTDPPYFDNIGYADLSDYFYVWLRRSLRPVFPGLFATLAVPKAEELVATPYRHGSKEKAEAFFLEGMTKAMQRLAEQSHPAFPVSIKDRGA